MSRTVRIALVFQFPVQSVDASRQIVRGDRVNHPGAESMIDAEISASFLPPADVRRTGRWRQSVCDLFMSARPESLYQIWHAMMQFTQIRCGRASARERA